MAKKNKPIKTNAMRALDEAHIAYTTREYTCHDTNERDLGLKIARELGEDPASVFKTLVLVSDDKQYVVCCLPVEDELDMKAAALISGHKHLELIPIKDLEKVTGYIRGGCTPVGMKKSYPTFIDETAQLFDQIIMSGGKPGVQLIVNPDDLIDFLHASYCSLTR